MMFTKLHGRIVQKVENGWLFRQYGRGSRELVLRASELMGFTPTKYPTKGFVELPTIGAVYHFYPNK